MNLIDTPIQPISLFLRSSSYTTAQDATKTNLSFNLNQPITNYQNMNILVACNSFQFINSFYTVNENNYKFIYKIYGSNSVLIGVPYGFYDIDSFISVLNTLLINIFTFSYDPTTYNVTIKHNLNLNFILLDDGLNQNIYELLGFNDIGFVSYTTNGLCISPSIFNMISVQVLHICLANVNLKSISLKNTAKYNIIASIFITAQFGSVQTYFSNNSFEYLINDDVISFINVVILDQDMNPVNFNNIDWFLNLSFKFIYKKELNIPKTLEQYSNEQNQQQQTTAVQDLIIEENENYLKDIINNI